MALSVKSMGLSSASKEHLRLWDPGRNCPALDDKIPEVIKTHWAKVFNQNHRCPRAMREVLDQYSARFDAGSLALSRAYLWGLVKQGKKSWLRRLRSTSQLLLKKFLALHSHASIQNE